MREKIKNKILNLLASDFDEIALEVFHYQYQYNRFYKQFVDLLGINISLIDNIYQIPHLPIQFFKNFSIQSGNFDPEAIFTSSGTTSSTQSRHNVREIDWYNQISESIFRNAYGELEDMRILALLPSYLERKGSSLIHMVQHFMNQNRGQGGFYLNEFEQLISELQKDFDGKTLLIGVSFALLDLAENYNLELKDTIVMETGGMKGRRKEMTRQELHDILSNTFGIEKIHSEYGMTELMSQAYSKGNGVFKMNNFLKIWTRDISDPFNMEKVGRVGAINIIDLGNLDSCSFLATDDLGRVGENNTFEVLGRLDKSDIRGCNLMYF